MRTEGLAHLGPITPARSLVQRARRDVSEDIARTVMDDVFDSGSIETNVVSVCSKSISGSRMETFASCEIRGVRTVPEKMIPFQFYSTL